MKKIIYNFLPLILVSLFIFPLVAQEATEDDTNDPSNPQELLEIVKQGQFADTQAQRDRERKFRNEKNSFLKTHFSCFVFLQLKRFICLHQRLSSVTW